MSAFGDERTIHGVDDLTDLDFYLNDTRRIGFLRELQSHLQAVEPVLL